jgi:hypothetical protein
MDQATLSLMYRTAARKIKRETLKRRFGLSVKYYLALQKYDDVSNDYLRTFLGLSCFLQRHRSFTFEAQIHSDQSAHLLDF